MTGQYEFWPRGSLFADISETLCQEVGDNHDLDMIEYYIRWMEEYGGMNQSVPSQRTLSSL